MADHTFKLLITAGPTRESLDPVRFITNRSSGKMGYALAAAAVEKGFSVVLVSGPVDSSVEPPPGLAEFVPVVSAAEMADAVKSRFPAMDAAILCAAVADYRPKIVAENKLKKKEGVFLLELERTEDILFSLGQMKKSTQQLIGFAAETENLAENALGKLKKKNLDWIAANQVGLPGQGFQSDQNEITLYGACGETIQLPLTDKKNLARQMLETIFQ